MMRLSLELLSLTLRSQFSVLGKDKYLRGLSLTQHIHHTRARVWSQYRAQAFQYSRLTIRSRLAGLRPPYSLPNAMVQLRSRSSTSKPCVVRSVSCTSSASSKRRAFLCASLTANSSSIDSSAPDAFALSKSSG